jgi:fatty acid-binding protein DegV
MLALDDVDMKVVNPGVASAGLCSLLVVLADGLRDGWDRPTLISRLDEIGPQCDTLFVPADLAWLGRSGRLPLIEDRTGEIGDGSAVVRVGSRLTGVIRADDRDAAIAAAVERAGARAPRDASLVVTIDHADDRAAAERVATAMHSRWPVSRLIVTDLSATIGSQLGPGAVGIGVAPALGGA